MTDKSNKFMTRFGTLEDVTERTGQKGPFITFKLQAKGFIQYGACFQEDVIAEMKASVGKPVWLKGPIDTHMGKDADSNPKEMQSFKVLYFKVTEPQAEKEELAAA